MHVRYLKFVIDPFFPRPSIFPRRLEPIEVEEELDPYEGGYPYSLPIGPPPPLGPPPSYSAALRALRSGYRSMVSAGILFPPPVCHNSVF